MSSSRGGRRQSAGQGHGAGHGHGHGGRADGHGRGGSGSGGGSGGGSGSAHIAKPTTVTVNQPRPQNNWVFTADELLSTPSAADGYSREREMNERNSGCQLILRVGMTLRLNQVVMASACMFLHRFYMRNSLRKHKYYDVAAACIYLATKVEESARKLNKVVQVVAQKAAKNDNLRIDENTKEYWRWREVILHYEGVILASLCYDIDVQHPYDWILSFTKQYKVPQKVLIHAWTFASEAIKLSTVYLRYKPIVIAGACLYIAAVLLGDMNSLGEFQSERKLCKEFQMKISDIEGENF
ncbi:hypothetical protein HK101_011154 [Irineochytrium annulatum]|nr:hypothetical protein HK101_011154 [Irineochytrium annulatum]